MSNATMTVEAVRNLRLAGKSYAEIGQEFGVNKGSAHRFAKKHGLLGVQADPQAAAEQGDYSGLSDADLDVPALAKTWADHGYVATSEKAAWLKAQEAGFIGIDTQMPSDLSDEPIREKTLSERLNSIEAKLNEDREPVRWQDLDWDEQEELSAFIRHGFTGTHIHLTVQDEYAGLELSLNGVVGLHAGGSMTLTDLGAEIVKGRLAIIARERSPLRDFYAEGTAPVRLREILSIAAAALGIILTIAFVLYAVLGGAK